MIKKRLTKKEFPVPILRRRSAMKVKKLLPWVVGAALVLVCIRLLVPQKDASTDAGTDTGTDIVVLTTTDMHGKCWDTDVLSGAPMPHNMLRVSTAVQEARRSYGDEHVILLDNGDLYQGSAVSEVHLVGTDHPEGEPEAMSLCLKEIGYDAMVLGNHEFNFPWDIMSGVYDDLRSGDVDVLGANVYYDGSDGTHSAGENAFGTYIVRDVVVNGHSHKVGILGLENSDISRWDLPVNYPGMVFAHPDNPDFDLAQEANRYIEQMQAEGCEMIILAYHGGIGQEGKELAFGVNTHSQGAHILEGTRDIDLLVLGHDHNEAYSNATGTDAAGRQVPIVNGGGESLTKTVFHLTEDSKGNLACELTTTENLDLSAYEPDKALEEKIKPYVDLASVVVDEPVGTLSGDWDGSEEYRTKQNDTIDLTSAAMLDIATKRMVTKYDAAQLDALKAKTGLDHLDADAAITNDCTAGYVAHSGTITTRDIYRMYRYANNLLSIPMHGRDLLAIMEENAAERLTTRVLNGQLHFFTAHDSYTYLLFGGINFSYDLAKPKGERVTIEGFSNGRPFDPDAVYLIVTNNYLLGNDACGLRSYTEDDTLWSQVADDARSGAQYAILEYIDEACKDGGSVVPDAFNWHWEMGYSIDVAALPPYDGPVVASLVEAPEDGHQYVLYQESEGYTLTNEPDTTGFVAASIPAYGNDLVDALPDNTVVLTAHMVGEDMLMLTDVEGRYLTCGAAGGISFTEEAAEGDLSLWQLIPQGYAYQLMSVGADGDQALESFGGKILTYKINPSAQYLFNFYEVRDGER